MPTLEYRLRTCDLQYHAPNYPKILTARAVTSPTVSREAIASIAMSNFARALSGSVSVGENAVAFVNAIKK